MRARVPLSLPATEALVRPPVRLHQPAAFRLDHVGRAQQLLVIRWVRGSPIAYRRAFSAGRSDFVRVKTPEQVLSRTFSASILATMYEFAG